MNTISRKLTAIVMIVLSVILVMTAVAPEVHAVKKTQKYWMQKTLKAYKKGQIKKARKYNKKLKKFASEKCVKNMTKTQKNLYIKIIDSYPLESDYSDKPYLWDYHLTDFNGDGKTDLIVKVGTCEADVRYKVFTCVKGKKKKLGSFGGSHSYLCKNTGSKGVVQLYQHMEYETLYKVYRKNGKVVYKKIRKTRKTKSYFMLRNELKSHAKWADDYGLYFSYAELYAE